MRILTIVPTYNEAENIVSLIDSLLTLDLELDIVIVDDNSPDGTGTIVEELALQEPRVQVVHRPAKLGLGTAYTTGFAVAMAQGYDRIITMDADFSHNPYYIPLLVRATFECDVAIGSRYVTGGGVREWGVHRHILSRCANVFARVLLRLAVRDCTSGFRCYRSAVLGEIDPASIHAEGYSYLVEMLWRVQRAGFSIAEAPIVFTDRRLGASKISKNEILKAALTVSRLAMMRGEQHD
ncbi:MAG: polyprenol monophosphomannose synthase [Chloroflexi bacterium]|nr:polyprenol monophosphomannose synthase [Chloroflexota bacterium]